MPITLTIADVGAQDPELQNSPIMSEGDDDFDIIAQDEEILAGCYFNNVSYELDDYVCSGSDLLRCKNGLWVNEGDDCSSK